MRGLCIRCRPGEAGLLVGKIRTDSFTGDFIGYTDPTATARKVVHNVLRNGDAYYNTGDIFVKDLLNDFAFLDRTGENFRWRGENVASMEVEGILSRVIGFKDCIVYGVEVPNCEGRAGVAAIVDTENRLNLDELAEKVEGALAPYARPVFIRALSSSPLTGTFKFMKKDLLKEGFNVHVIKDPMYYLTAEGSYRKLTKKVYQDILSGIVKI